MFGFFQLARHARRWHANHQRALMERSMFDLPLELQKDIGWPAVRDNPPAIMSQADQRTPLGR